MKIFEKVLSTFHSISGILSPGDFTLKTFSIVSSGKYCAAKTLPDKCIYYNCYKRNFAHTPNKFDNEV